MRMSLRAWKEMNPKCTRYEREDSVEFGNTWGRGEVCSDVGMDIVEDKF